MFTQENAYLASLFISLFSFIAACAALIIARSAATYSRAVERYLRQKEPESQIAALSGQMTELTDAYDALLKSHKKLRSRITMRENRQKGRDTDDDPDLSSMTDKTALRHAAKRAGLLK